MKYGSVCSGVEAATVAWHPLGWEPQWFSEIEKFPSAVLAHHYPDTPNYGDMTAFKEWPDDRSIDLLVGGTPCQSFSVAGLRKGLDDPRGNLMLTYLAIAAQYRPKWLVWENVPGVLSSNRGRDFGSFLGALGQCGYGFAYRVLDAQFFGVPQRRRRVFVVGCAGDWRRAAAVLFERESLSGHPAPSRKARQETAETIAACSFSGGAGGRPDGAAVNHFVPIGNVQDGSIATLSSREYKGLSCGRDGMTSAAVIAFGAQNSAAQGDSVSTQVTPTLYKSKTPAVAIGIDHDHNAAVELMGPLIQGPQGSPRNAVMQAVVYDTTNITSPQNGSNPKPGDPVFTLASGQHPPLLTPAVAWDEELNAREELAGTLLRGGAGGRHDGVLQASAVRRLTPVECERLQGFPDDYTQIEWRNKPAENCPDGPRYKAMGNSMAVPVMRWIGERISMVDAL